MYCAHSRADDSDESSWEPLDRHLLEVAELAESFAEVFGSGEIGRVAGLWHDLGKYHEIFQRYIRGNPQRFGHAALGALLAWRLAPGTPAGCALALVIAGHHGGLADHDGNFLSKLQARSADLDALMPAVPAPIRECHVPAPPLFLGRAASPHDRGPRRVFEMWIRFVFSALVDADSLATERFDRGDVRSRLLARQGDLDDLQTRLDRHLEGLCTRALHPIDHLRAEILTACRAKTGRPRGFFSLTVPTGGGKTLAGMAFALAHVRHHGLRRVIVVVPFTSILEQSAEVYEKAFGEANVVQHHSNLDPESETDLNRAAAENWDAPIVVTTTVQLFESLFANRRSRCRKLHNIAGSVLLLDEAQNLPRRLLAPILDALKTLVDAFGCTVVFSTATQPALRRRSALCDGIPEIEEIMPDPQGLARRLDRYDVHWPLSEAPIAWQDLAAELVNLPQVLAIVHRRQDARDLGKLLPENGYFHLSALMCPAHRSQRILEIKEKLRQGGLCRVVSTQVAEAGVDFSFPVVYRAVGGLDSMTQAGGRCNRHGELPRGQLRLFHAPTSPPPGILTAGLEATRVLRSYGRNLDRLTDPGIMLEYFNLLYASGSKDEDGVNGKREQLHFREVAALFRLIDDDWQQAVVVPWGEGGRLLDLLRSQLRPDRRLLRALQRFTVNIPRSEAARLLSGGILEKLTDAEIVALVPAAGRYHPELGLLLEGGNEIDPANLVV